MIIVIYRQQLVEKNERPYRTYIRNVRIYWHLECKCRLRESISIDKQRAGVYGCTFIHALDRVGRWVVRVTRFNLSSRICAICGVSPFEPCLRAREMQREWNLCLCLDFRTASTAGIRTWGGMHEDRFEKKESDHLRLRKMERENGNYRRVECKSGIRFRIDLLLEI